MRAYARSLATVIAISGDIDSSNVDLVRENASRFLSVDKAVILDLSAVNSFDAQGLRFPLTFDDECAEAGVEWALVASPEISMTLAAADDTLPVVTSVAQALQRFSNPARRRALLELVTRAARTRVKRTSPTDS